MGSGAPCSDQEGEVNLSPKLSHQHIITKQQEWLSPRTHLGCSVYCLPHCMGNSDICRYSYTGSE